MYYLTYIKYAKNEWHSRHENGYTITAQIGSQSVRLSWLESYFNALYLKIFQRAGCFGLLPSLPKRVNQSWELCLLRQSANAQTALTAWLGNAHSQPALFRTLFVTYFPVRVAISSKNLAYSFAVNGQLPCRGSSHRRWWLNQPRWRNGQRLPLAQ